MMKWAEEICVFFCVFLNSFAKIHVFLWIYRAFAKGVLHSLQWGRFEEGACFSVSLKFLVIMALAEECIMEI